MILSVIDNATTGIWNLALFIWIVALVIYLSITAGTGRLDLGLPAIAGFIDISNIIHSFNHDKSCSISQ